MNKNYSKGGCMKIVKIVSNVALVLFTSQLQAVEDVQKVMSGPCVIAGGNPRTMVLAGREYQDVKWCGFGYIDSKGNPFTLNTYSDGSTTFWGRTSRRELSVIPGAFLLIIVENYAYVISWKGSVEVLDLSQGQAKSVRIIPAKFPYREPSADRNTFQSYMSGFSYEVTYNKIWIKQQNTNEPAVRINITDPTHPVVG